MLLLISLQQLSESVTVALDVSEVFLEVVDSAGSVLVYVFFAALFMVTFLLEVFLLVVVFTFGAEASGVSSSSIVVSRTGSVYDGNSGI